MHVCTMCRCCMVRNQRDDRYKLLQTTRRCTCFEHMLHMHKSSVEILDDYLQFATFPHFNEKCIDLCVHSTLCSTSVKSTFNGNYSKNWYWLFGCCTHTCRTVNLSTLYDIKTKRVYFMLTTHQKTIPHVQAQNLIRTYVRSIAAYRAKYKFSYMYS